MHGENKNKTGSGGEVRAKELLWKQCAVDADGTGPGAVALIIICIILIFFGMHCMLGIV